MEDAELEAIRRRADAASAAATVIQNPERYVDIADHRWDENADFIAHAREDIARLLDEIERLRARS